ncbi:fructose-specific phosphotransferase system IIC component [Alkalibacillus flavidus]|uniref:Fructose-specific phosphotransferase system IIC component n=1 Tax=Alkalibacillus flavidus TaxID=546021 RepID=A0ABV2KUQ3_9BACI
MDKISFAKFVFLGIIAGIVLSGIIKWIGFDFQLWQTIFGEPTLLSALLVIVISSLIIYVLIRSMYKKYEQSSH